MEGREGETSAHSPVNIASGSSVLFAAKLLSSLGFLFTTLLIAKAVGVAGSGAYRFLSVAALIAGQFAQIGLPLVAPLLVARHHGRERDLLTTLVGTSFVFGLGSALVTIVALVVYGTSAVSLAVVAVSAVMIGIGETVQGFGQGLGRFREYSIVTVIAPWLYGLLLTIFWYFDSLTLRVALVLYAVEWAAWALGQLFVASRMTGFGKFDRVLAREALALGWRALVGSLSLFLNNRVDQILLNLFKGNRAGGIYGLAVNVAEILLYLPRVVGIVLVPAIASRRRASPDDGPAPLPRDLRDDHDRLRRRAGRRPAADPVRAPRLPSFGRAVHLARAGRARLRRDERLLGCSDRRAPPR